MLARVGPNVWLYRDGRLVHAVWHAVRQQPRHQADDLRRLAKEGAHSPFRFVLLVSRVDFQHGRGGQSALRFARLRLEKRHNYLRKVAELATQHFITNDVPNVRGLVLAGLSLFKNDLSKSDLFDPRLSKVVVAIVDVAYGGENGFSQAIDLASESLLNVRYVAERKLLSRLFEEIDKVRRVFFSFLVSFFFTGHGQVLLRSARRVCGPGAGSHRHADHLGRPGPDSRDCQEQRDWRD
jgi:hypothetical protein